MAERSRDSTLLRARAGTAVELIAELGPDLRDPHDGRVGRDIDGEPEFFWSPINSLDDVLVDDQFHAAGGVVYVPDGDDSVPMIASPADFSGTPAQPAALPETGEHTEEVLRPCAARPEPAFTNTGRTVTLFGDVRSGSDGCQQFLGP